MNLILIALSAIGGLLLLYFGAEYLVRGGSAIAARLRISPLVIGLTLVAFGTSAPELFVSACAALRGLGDVCVGNIVGSNICNIALILGLTALIAPIGVNPLILKRDMPVMVAASLLLTAVCWFRGGMGWVLGLVFLAGLVVYTVISVRSASDWAETLRPEMSSGAAWFGVVGGLIALIVGSRMLLWPLLGARGRLARADGVILLLVYVGYLIWLVNAM